MTQAPRVHSETCVDWTETVTKPKGSLGIRSNATRRTFSLLWILHPRVDEHFELRPQVGHVERVLANDEWLVMHRLTAIPAEAIYTQTMADNETSDNDQPGTRTYRLRCLDERAR